MPLKAESKITMAAVHTAMPIIEMREIKVTIERLVRLNKYLFAM